jgi:hypothetical protein
MTPSEDSGPNLWVVPLPQAQHQHVRDGSDALKTASSPQAQCLCPKYDAIAFKKAAPTGWYLCLEYDANAFETVALTLRQHSHLKHDVIALKTVAPTHGRYLCFEHNANVLETAVAPLK